jgi:phage replication O-like protein O
MTNRQFKDGYTPIANKILENLARMHLSSNQWQVLLYIIRRTLGFHKTFDYVANYQIVEATGLCKSVVSRALHNLSDFRLIVRKGKLIALQTDWEKWRRLVEPQTNEKLAILSHELVKSSTKVCSPCVTQNIKDNYQNITNSGKSNESFEQYIECLRKKFSDLDFNLELEKFNLYWEGKRNLDNPKLVLFIWMLRARKFKHTKEGKDNGNKINRGIPGNRPAGAFDDLENRD